MKKFKVVICSVISAILVLSIFTACSGKQKEHEPETSKNPTENITELQDQSDSSNPSEEVAKTNEQTSEEEKLITLTEAEEIENDYIYEKYHYEGERTAQNEKQEYKFRLPQLKSTSSQAEEINRKIITQYEGLIKEQIAYAVNPDMLYDNIYWRSYINNGLLSIVIVDDTLAYDYKTYSVYLFDTNTEKTVNNSAILAKAGISEEDFISMAKEIAKELFSEVDFGSIDGAEKIKKERLDYMLSEDNISINTPMFIDDTGSLNAIIEIGQAGGADYKYEIIKINK